MATKQPDSKVAKDMAFGQPLMINTTPDGDMKGNQDCIIGNGFGIAYRTRRFPVTKFGEISIRFKRENGAKTEYQKILDGECKSYLFIFEFTNVFIVCSAPSILQALKNKIGYPKLNNDKATWAYYIPINDIPHLMFYKGIL